MPHGLKNSLVLDFMSPFVIFLEERCQIYIFIPKLYN